MTDVYYHDIALLLQKLQHSYVDVDSSIVNALEQYHDMRVLPPMLFDAVSWYNTRQFVNVLFALHEADKHNHLRLLPVLNTAVYRACNQITNEIKVEHETIRIPCKEGKWTEENTNLLNNVTFCVNSTQRFDKLAMQYDHKRDFSQHELMCKYKQWLTGLRCWYRDHKAIDAVQTLLYHNANTMNRYPLMRKVNKSHAHLIMVEFNAEIGRVGLALGHLHKVTTNPYQYPIMMIHRYEQIKHQLIEENKTFMQYVPEPTDIVLRLHKTDWFELVYKDEPVEVEFIDIELKRARYMR